MAGRQGRLRKTTNAGPRRSPRRGIPSRRDADIPDVFQDMLLEAAPSVAAGLDEDTKPLKKRRITAPTRLGQLHPAQELDNPPLPPSKNVESDEEEEKGGRTRQTIQDSDESDDSDLEWEDALGEGDDQDEQDEDTDAAPEVGDISITIGGDKLMEQERAKKSKKRGMTTVEKKQRLAIHKMHILCLLYHVHRRNSWCNDGAVQATLRNLPSPDTLLNLVPNPDFTQLQASKRFIDGMQALKLLWSNRFSVTAMGMHKQAWADTNAEVLAFSAYDNLDIPMDRQDFRKAAESLQGSQDVGAQLFCALLRGIGVEARLVCSLQCLPFASISQASNSQKQASTLNTIHLDPFNRKESPSPSKPKAITPSRPKRLSRLERVLGERSAALNSGVAPKQKKKYHTAYPVYWVEAFNPANQKWIPIDPLSTFTVDKADKLEPPLSYTQSSLSYAVGFEEDYTVKDVTRRYAKAYNAKTRKLRVDSTEEGAKWWRQALKMFKRRIPLDRDQVEDAELARKEANEPMPKNVQDFKNHPIYVLERHLRHNEVIHPMQQVGKVNVSSAMNPKMEPIYRRKDVHIVRSADKWYRMGRDVRDGEQPLKHAKPKKGVRRSVPPDEADDQFEEIGVGLYAIFQTEIYVPPPVVQGRVPRNAFGNLDVYVPSMVPPGGVHVRHKLASKAARIVGVDSADAVTGFSFKGRQGTAVIQGVVVAQEYKDAVEAVIEAMEYASEEAENAQRRSEALRMWRRFCLGLRIVQRVNAIEIDGETGPVVDVQDEIERQDKRMTEQQLAGGFFMEEPTTPPPTIIHPEIRVPDNDFDGRFIPEESPEVPAAFGSSLLSKQPLPSRRDDDFGGGFVPEEGPVEASRSGPQASPPAPSDSLNMQITNNETELGGGFMPGDEATESRTPNTTQVDGYADGFAGGFIVEEEQAKDTGVDSATVHQAAQTSGTGLTQDVCHVTVAAGGQTTQEEANVGGAAVSEKERERRPTPMVESESSLPSFPPSEAGSLPLEDPEDEDADPDWLVDAT